jgi:hypothetical protein
VIPLRPGEALPNNAARGEIVIIGDCDAMYLADGMPLNGSKPSTWNPLVRSEAGGRFLRTITFPLEEPGTRRPLATVNGPDGTAQVYAEWMGGAGVRFVYDGPGSGFPSIVHYLPPDRAYDLDLVLDPQIGFLQIWLDDLLMHQDIYRAAPGSEVTIGEDAIDDPQLEDEWAGRLDPQPERNIELCRELRREAGQGVGLSS